MRTLVLTTALLVSLVAFACSAAANDSPPRGAADFPPSCRLHAEAVFWTASDWVPLSEALASDSSPCADY